MNTSQPLKGMKGKWKIFVKHFLIVIFMIWDNQARRGHTTSSKPAGKM
jgi:hypothetical protein